ncbi:NAD(P)-dependent dehydrogenase (short-subunit alcohol dehydrogenase family) [Micromonospora kangleipakensis]|uniref:NAD(P)-dependent dehydrogenase (Short-subunit alcohol dehydrogenase family) n=1 Tax=Micromonospora kangleipakensis TaxID=1077942 RepID=A0A4Q8BC06_9ACTN|nr:SDR family oxidoreductase [Micromonospora kangleipakensis]RZU75377.1 NAD(P)-dependent dehydrogenase (short-subunit alcohol dehydrogenase family) [Micromonospora kangleipakensis]
MAGRLDGRTALVTGSTSGIGRVIATAYAAEGAYVIVTGRRVDEGGKRVAEIAEAGGRATFVPADLRDGEGVAALARTALAATDGRIDILVNNAAALVGGRASTETDERMIDRVLATNVKAPLLLASALVPPMLDRGEGVIVNVGSINGMIGMNGAALYGASKAALHSLTKSWSAEWGRRGVRVNTVAPGPTETEWNEGLRDQLKRLVDTSPSGRLSGAAEVAAVAVFLASGDASHLHGVTIPVDGGMTAVRGFI